MAGRCRYRLSVAVIRRAKTALRKIFQAARLLTLRSAGA